MAKKLLTSYTFTTGAENVGTVVVSGTYTLEQFLLVTNVTRGTVLYQFNVAARGGTVVSAGGYTTLTLEIDTRGMNAADRLQVFVDDGQDAQVTLTNASVEISNDVGNAVPVSAASLPLPSGAATAANQSTANTSLSSIDGKLPALSSGNVPVLPAVQLGMGVATATTQRVTLATDGAAVTALTSIDGKTAALVGGRVPVDGSAVTQPVSGTVTKNNPAALLSSYSVAGVITINTVLLTLDCSLYRSVSIQCTSMGTTGVVTPEWSNDNTTWVGATILTPAGATATTFNAAGLWTVPVLARYLRLRLSTATTAGTTTLSVHQFDDSRQMWLATQPVSGTVTANIGTGSIAAGTNAIGDVGLQYRGSATGAANAGSVVSPATAAATSLKATAGRLLGCKLYNATASARYLKLFNVASPTLGTTAAIYELVLPPNSYLDFQFPGGLAHSTAIVYAITSAPGLTDNTSTGLAAGDIRGIIAWA